MFAFRLDEKVAGCPPIKQRLNMGKLLSFPPLEEPTATDIRSFGPDRGAAWVVPSRLMDHPALAPQGAVGSNRPGWPRSFDDTAISAEHGSGQRLPRNRLSFRPIHGRRAGATASRSGCWFPWHASDAVCALHAAGAEPVTRRGFSGTHRSVGNDRTRK